MYENCLEVCTKFSGITNQFSWKESASDKRILSCTNTP